MADAFYPFVDNPSQGQTSPSDGHPALEVRHAARIAVFDDLAAAPRVVVIEPTDIRSYLEQITAAVMQLAVEQGSQIPFMVVREVVENFIHAYFMEPTISILDKGNTIRFSDQGPGIADKDLALKFGTTSATADMKQFIRGVGSGLPYVQYWLEEKGGTLTVEDNIHGGTVVTVSLAHQGSEPAETALSQPPAPAQGMYPQGQAWPQQAGYPAQPIAGGQPYPAQPWAGQGSYPPQVQQPGYPQPYPTPQPDYGQQNPYYAQPQNPYYPQPTWQQQPWQQPAAWPQQGAGAAAYPGAAWPAAGGMAAPQVSERGQFVLDYLRTHESVGPRDLNAANPLSESTWSRVLAQLEEQGLVSKQGGQKRHLTPAGRQLLGM